MIEVSVVIPAYNRADTLERAITSVFLQGQMVREVIIVDDCSTDNTATLMKALSERYDSLRYIRNSERLGGGGARNAGAAFATSEYLSFLDSDDEWIGGKLNQQLELFFRSPTASCVAGWTKKIDINRAVVGIDRPPEILKKIDFTTHNPLGGTSLLLVKKDVFELVGGFDHRLPSCQDWDLFLRLAEVGPISVVQDNVLLHHVDGADRITKNLDAAITGRNMLFEKINNSKGFIHSSKTSMELRQRAQIVEVYIRFGIYKLAMLETIRSPSIWAVRKWLKHFAQIFRLIT